MPSPASSAVTKESVRKIIGGRDFVALVDSFDADPYATRRYLTRLTYHPDAPEFASAVEGIRVISAARAAGQEAFFTEILRRRIWAMNEEGGNNDWSAPEAACAVIAGNPGLFGHFFSYVFHAACDELMFRPSLVRGWRMLRRHAPDVTRPFDGRMEAIEREEGMVEAEKREGAGAGADTAASTSAAPTSSGRDIGH